MFTPIHDRRSSAGHAIVQGIRPLGRQSARDLAHDRNDLLHDITAGAAASTSQQTPHRRANLRLGGRKNIGDGQS
jgi:hypothetical protein